MLPQRTTGSSTGAYLLEEGAQWAQNRVRGSSNGGVRLLSSSDALEARETRHQKARRAERSPRGQQCCDRPSQHLTAQHACLAAAPYSLQTVQNFVRIT